MTIKALIIMTALLLGYASSTWLLFGAVHPCEILVVRQKDHSIAIAERLHVEDLESMKEVARKALPKENYARFVETLDEYSNASLRVENQKHSVMTDLRRRTREMGTAQCAWQAATWQPAGT